jgi:hypothetical protein
LHPHSYVFVEVSCLGVLKPLMVYRTLLADSRFWMGLLPLAQISKQRSAARPGAAGEHTQSRSGFYRAERTSSYDITAPLLGLR